jgi:hypothetical protein
MVTTTLPVREMGVLLEVEVTVMALTITAPLETSIAVALVLKRMSLLVVV